MVDIIMTIMSISSALLGLSIPLLSSIISKKIKAKTEQSKKITIKVDDITIELNDSDKNELISVLEKYKK